MFENTPLEDGANRVREALGSIEDELTRVQKDLQKRRTKLERRLTARRKQIEKQFAAQRRDLEKRARKLRSEIEKNPTVKRLESARKDARKQFEQGVADFLETLRIASKSDVQRIDRKLSQLGRKLKEMEKASAS